MTAGEFAAILDARKIRDGQWVAVCPSHPDKNPSLKITDAGDKTLIRCFAGCDNADILRAAGLVWVDLFPDAPRGNMRRQRPRLKPPVSRIHPDPGRLLRDEIYVRRRVETYAETLLAADPADEAAWDALGIAYRGLAEAESELDRLEGRR